MMSEGMGMDTPTEETGVVDSVDLPQSIIGDKTVAEGDVIRLEVVGVDAGGTIKVRYAHPKDKEAETTETEPEPSIEGLAKAFD